MSENGVKETITDLLETGLGEQAGKCYFCGRAGDRVCLWCDSKHMAGWAAKAIRASLGICRKSSSLRASEAEIRKHWEEYYSPKSWKDWTDTEKYIWQDNFKKRIDEKLIEMNCPTGNMENII